MAAIYPSGIRTFPTYANGDQVTPATINDPNLEITAIETGLRQGLAHDVIPDLTANNRNLGSSGQQWHDLHLSGSMTVAGGITGTITLENLVVTGTVVIASGSLLVNGPILGAEYLALRGNRVAGQAVLTVENDDPAGLAALFRATTGAGIIVQLQDIAQVPRFDLHADGSMNTSGNLTIAGNAVIGGTLTVSGLTDYVRLTVSGPVAGAASLTVVNADNTGQGLIVRGGTGAALVAEFQSATGTPTHDFLANGNLNISGTLTGAAVTTNVLDVRTQMQAYLQPATTVAATPVTIFTTTRPHAPADVAGLVLVCGTKLSDATSQFVDLLLVMTDGTATTIAHHEKGSVLTHVYAWSGLNLQLSFVNPVSHQIFVLPVMVGSTSTP